jgi:hypothetical protein
MSNLSFARIMYGTTQENRVPVYVTVANRPHYPSQMPAPSIELRATGSTIERLLHKAWRALTN